MSLKDLTRKPDKIRDEWEKLRQAGMADYDPVTDSYTLNEVGLVGDLDEYIEEITALREQGLGPL